MAKINVLKPFRLNLGGLIRPIAAGIQDVEPEVAEHWYTKVHSEPVAEAEKAAPPAEPEPDAPEGASDAPAADGGEPDDGEPTADAGDDAPADMAGDGQTDAPADKTDDGAPADPTEAEKAALKAEAEALGIEVDGRWGIPKLKAAIKAKKG